MTTTKEKIIYALIIAWLALVIVMILWHLSGHSPAIEELLAVIAVGPYLFTFGVYERLNSRISQAREDFQKDLGDIKGQLGRIEGKLNAKGS